MTKYTNFDSDSKFELWGNIFLVLSSESFNSHIDNFCFLGKDVNLPQSLLELAKEFGIVFLRSNAQMNENILDYKLQYLTDMSEEQSITFAWQKTFELLDLMGFAELVYKMGKIIYIQRNLLANHTSISYKERFLFVWLDEYPNIDSFLYLELSNNIQQQILLEISQYLRNYWKIMYQIERVLHSQLSSWDKYVLYDLGLGRWIGSRIIDNYQLLMWSKIIRLMQVDELTLFDKWLNHHVSELYEKTDTLSLHDVASILDKVE